MLWWRSSWSSVAVLSQHSINEQGLRRRYSENHVTSLDRQNCRVQKVIRCGSVALGTNSESIAWKASKVNQIMWYIVPNFVLSLRLPKVTVISARLGKVVPGHGIVYDSCRRKGGRQAH